jgi:hypothetical protein
MKMNRVKGTVARTLLVVTLLFVFVTLSGEAAQAQHRQGFHRHGGRARVHARVFIHPRRWHWHDRWHWYDRTYPYYYGDYYFPSSHVTEGQGYHDGLDDGKDDAKDRKAFDPYRHKDYKNAVTSAYIDGYLRGYGEGYRRVNGQ